MRFCVVESDSMYGCNLDPSTENAATHISVVLILTAAQSVSIVVCRLGRSDSKSFSCSALFLHRMIVNLAITASFRRQLMLFVAVPVAFEVGDGNFSM